MGDLTEKNSSGSSKIVGADGSGNENNYVDVTSEGKAKVVESYNDTVNQLSIDISGNGVTAFLNLNNTQLWNMSGRTGVRVVNRGKKIAWRIFGDLTGSDGEIINKNETVDFPYGDNIIIEVVESDNEIDIIITEYK